MNQERTDIRPATCGPPPGSDDYGAANIMKNRIIKPLDYVDRKNSNSDLHSRLKTRKVLGVGEIRDDKDVYRSKISQILGHSEQLHGKLPIGIYCWHTINILYFVTYGVLCLICPATVASFDFSSYSGDYSCSYRLYGSMLLGYAILYRQLILTNQKALLSVGLKSAILIFLLQTLTKLFGGVPMKHIGIQIFGFVSNLIIHELVSSSKFLSISWLNELIECTSGNQQQSQMSGSASAAEMDGSPVDNDDERDAPIDHRSVSKKRTTEETDSHEKALLSNEKSKKN